MTLFLLRGRLHAAILCAILSSWTAVAFSSPEPASEAAVAPPPWAVPFGAEFWRTPGRDGLGWTRQRQPLGQRSPVKVGDAIERVQHAFRSTSPTEWSVRGRGYSATLSPQGLQFLPLAGDQEVLNIAASRVELGRQTLFPSGDDAGPWHVAGNTAQRLRVAALGLIEHLEAVAAGVEVSWVLRCPPAAAADLIITLELDGRARPVEAGGGWRLTGQDERAAIRVGEIVVVDAAGRRTRLTPQVEEHGLSIVVPAELLRDADYPLAIDPLISAEFDLDQPSVSAAPSAQFAPALASDGTNYLVVWHDNRNGPTLDLYAARVTPGGALLDLSGFAITTATNDQWFPAVAFNGTNYLVAWQDARSGGQDIYAARVTPAGRVIETNGLAIVRLSNDQRLPAVASLGGDFLVVWQDGRNGVANQDIYAARLTGNGVLVETNGFLVSNANNNQSAPAVGVVGSNYVTAWHDFRSSISLDVYAARITPTGGVLDPGGILVSAAVNDQWNVALAGNGTTGLIVWQDGRNGENDDIFGARLNESGAVLDPGGLPISLSAKEQRNPTAIPLGNDFYVAWQDSRAGLDFDVYGTTVATGSGAPRSGNR